jgi:circadian clock protein KaiC
MAEREGTLPDDVIATGVPGLDTLLGGGIPAGSLILVAGAPGTGKTLLCQQLCFNQVVQSDRRAIYFSTLSEPHHKLVRQLQPFSFYKPQHLGESVVLLALQEFLKQGLEATAETIMRTTRQQRAGLVCIDGFRAIEAASLGELEARQFLYQLSAQLHLLGATVIVTLERDPLDQDNYGAYTVADGVVACHYTTVGVRQQRRIEVRKLRTMAHLHGLHTYRISSDGWTIFPRIEALIPAETSHTAPAGAAGRIGFGVPSLDRLFENGFAAGSTTLIVGGLGTGKTTLGLHYLSEGLRRGEPGLLIGFGERRDQLLEKADYFGLPLRGGQASGLLKIRTFAPVEVKPDEISTVIREEIVSRGVRRVVIDEVFELERASEREDRAYDFFGALATYLQSAGVALCVTKSINKIGASEIDFSGTPLSVVAENLLLLRLDQYGGNIKRTLTTLKMRDGEPDRNVHEYSIGPAGLEIKDGASDATGDTTPSPSA